MDNRLSSTPFLTLILTLAIAGCGGGPDVSPAEHTADPIATDCLAIHGLGADALANGGARTVFRATDCDGDPISDLGPDHVVVSAGSDGVVDRESWSLTRHVSVERRAIVLVDHSASVTEHLSSVVAGARTAAHRLLDAGFQVGLYSFDGGLGSLQAFTAEQRLIDRALDTMAGETGSGIANLHGAIVDALYLLDAASTNGVVHLHTLLVFTDGGDGAGDTSVSSVQSALGSSDAHVAMVALDADDSTSTLSRLAPAGLERADAGSELAAAFGLAARRILDIDDSLYVIGACPAAAPDSLDLEVGWRGYSGALGGNLTGATAAGPGCDPHNVARPCLGLDCGVVDGHTCGSCGAADYCTGANVCEAACGGEIECGDSHGVDCGDCSELGETWACDENSCLDACAEAECGDSMGIDCGDCSELGATWTCQANSCLDACDGVECGEHYGVQCGDCSEHGFGFGCNASYECAYFCDGAECGDVMGVDCGECPGDLICDSGNICQLPVLPDMTWVQVPGGELTLGCNNGLDSSCDVDEQREDVELSDFWIMDTEVTVAMYTTCVEESACSPSHVDTGTGCNYGVIGKEDHPINCIDWAGLREFCAFLGADLPTEAQWERAYRGDHDDVIATYWIYPWGNAPAPGCTQVVMNDGGLGCGDGGTHEVAGKPATSYDLYNMGGNAAEWVLDWYGPDLGACDVPGCLDPTGPAIGDERVVRGGAYDDFFDSAFRTAKRNSDDPALQSPAVGGRCAR